MDGWVGWGGAAHLHSECARACAHTRTHTTHIHTTRTRTHTKHTYTLHPPTHTATATATHTHTHAHTNKGSEGSCRRTHVGGMTIAHTHNCTSRSFLPLLLMQRPSDSDFLCLSLFLCPSLCTVPYVFSPAVQRRQLCTAVACPTAAAAAAAVATSTTTTAVAIVVVRRDRPVEADAVVVEVGFPERCRKPQHHLKLAAAAAAASAAGVRAEGGQKLLDEWRWREIE